MIKLSIPDMSCSHCGNVISKAVKGIDPSAEVQFDYAARKAMVRSGAGVAEISKAVDAAGYPNTVD